MAKKRYNICMDEKLHEKLVRHAKRKKYDSFSHLVSELGKGLFLSMKILKGDK